jgi:adenylosuccinate synthase
MIDFADVIVDLQAGDTGKGKVANFLVKTNDEYTHIIRYNGGGNAGHTFYHNDEKIVTHYIPVGVIHNKKSIIGPGCVVNPKKLLNEIQYLENMGFDVRSFLTIDKRVHIVKDEYIEEDTKDTEIGTTKTGNGPTYRNKYGRTGIRAENCEELKDFIIDIYQELHGINQTCILFEGAQGFELDIDWGDYPYVTSSHCTTGSAILNGIPPQKIREVYGIAKAYRTYVGAKKFETDNPLFETIREKFNEYGSTTGRPRQINWLDLDTLIKSANINGVTKLIINKFDAIKEIGHYELIYNSKNLNLKSDDEFVNYVKLTLLLNCPLLKEITFSETPYKI